MKVTHEQGDPRSLRLLEDNAQFMPAETFKRLVENIRHDGVLQQWPFVWRDQETGVRTVLSGNHRVKAAIQAGLETIDWTECDENLSYDERMKIQLSHNAIVGESDPAILARLYESITDVEERMMTGLDDATLELLEKVSASSLAEANLDYTALAIVFLPDEYERAEAAMKDAKSMLSSDKVWLARYEQHNAVLDAVEDARESAHVMNAATALDVLLGVWDAHREDLKARWLDGDEVKSHREQDGVPVTSMTGMTVTSRDGVVIERALLRAVEKGGAKNRGEALAMIAQRYLDTLK